MDIRPKLPSSSDFEQSLNERVSTADQAVGAAGELSALSSLTESSTFYLGKKYYDATTQSEKTPAAELRKRYPGFENVLGNDEHPAMAQMMVEKEQKRRELEGIVATGPKGLWQGTREFGAGVGAAMTDPMEATINIGGLLLTGGMAGLARLAGTGLARVGAEATAGAVIRAAGTSTIESAAARIGARVGVGEVGTSLALNAAENVAQTAVSETSNALATNASGREMTAGEVAQNIAISGAAGIGFDLGMKAVIHGAGKALRPVEKEAAAVAPTGGEPGRISGEAPVASAKVPELKYVQEQPKVASLGGVPDGVTEHVIRDAERQVSAGVVVDQSLERGQLVRETFNDGGGRYEFRPYDQAENRPLYSASEVNVQNVNDAPSVSVGEYMGEDIVHLTDNPHAAEALAARGSTEGPGAHFEVELDPSAKLMDLNSKDEVSAVILEKYQTARANEDVAEINRLNQELKDSGFDGVHHSGGEFLGGEAPKQNSIVVWNRDKIIQKQKFDGDSSKLPLTPPEEVRAKALREADPKNSIRYDAEAVKALDIAEQQPKPKLDVAEVKDTFTKLDEDVKAAVERSEITEAEYKAMVEETRVERAKLKDTQKAWRQLLSCKVGK